MRKISCEYENPFDDKLLEYVEGTDQIYKDLDLTPNHLTTLSLIFGILAAYSFYKNNRILSVIFLFISYYYDCMDGHYARKYHKVTTFGDYYDHFSDIFKFSLIFYYMYLINPEKFKKLSPFLVIFVIIIIIHMACQEKLNNLNHEQPLLGALKNLCIINPEWIHVTKYFGCGTLVLLVATLIIFY